MRRAAGRLRGISGLGKPSGRCTLEGDGQVDFGRSFPIDEVWTFRVGRCWSGVLGIRAKRKGEVEGSAVHPRHIFRRRRVVDAFAS